MSLQARNVVEDLRFATTSSGATEIGTRLAPGDTSSGARCSVTGCTSVLTNPTLTFHRFPLEQELLSSWLMAISRSDWRPITTDYICSKHFTSADYRKDRTGRPYLKKNAIPSVFNDLNITSNLLTASHSVPDVLPSEGIKTEFTEAMDELMPLNATHDALPSSRGGVESLLISSSQSSKQPGGNPGRMNPGSQMKAASGSVGQFKVSSGSLGQKGSSMASQKSIYLVQPTSGSAGSVSTSRSILLPPASGRTIAMSNADFLKTSMPSAINTMSQPIFSSNSGAVRLPGAITTSRLSTPTSMNLSGKMISLSQSPISRSLSSNSVMMVPQPAIHAVTMTTTAGSGQYAHSSGTGSQASASTLAVTFASRTMDLDGNVCAVKEFLCNFCQFKVASADEFDAHIAAHVFTCNRCAYRAWTRHAVLVHKRDVHPMNSVNDLCGYEGIEAFNELSLLTTARAPGAARASTPMVSSVLQSPISIPPSIGTATITIAADITAPKLLTPLSNQTAVGSSLSSVSNQATFGPRCTAPQLRAVLAQSLSTRSNARGIVSSSPSAAFPSTTVAGMGSAGNFIVNTSKAGGPGGAGSYFTYKIVTNPKSKVQTYECDICLFRTTKIKDITVHASTHPISDLSRSSSLIGSGVGAGGDAGSMGRDLWECYYCPYSSTLQPDVVSHVIAKHSDMPIQLRRSVPPRSTSNLSSSSSQLTASSCSVVNKTLSSTDKKGDPKENKKVALASEAIGAGKDCSGEAATDIIWGCYFCVKTSHDRDEVITHIRLEHPGEKLTVTRRKITRAAATSTAKSQIAEATCDELDQSGGLGSNSVSSLLEKSRRKQVLPRRITDESSKEDVTLDDIGSRGLQDQASASPFILDDRTGEILSGSEKTVPSGGVSGKANSQEIATKTRTSSRKRVANKSREVDGSSSGVIEDVIPPQRKMIKRQIEAGNVIASGLGGSNNNNVSSSRSIPLDQDRRSVETQLPPSTDILSINSVDASDEHSEAIIASPAETVENPQGIRKTSVRQNDSTGRGKKRNGGSNDCGVPAISLLTGERTPGYVQPLNSTSPLVSSASDVSVVRKVVEKKPRRSKLSNLELATSERKPSSRRESRNILTPSQAVMVPSQDYSSTVDIIYRSTSTTPDPRQGWACPYCPFKCNQSSSAVTHVSVHHETRSLRVICMKSVRLRSDTDEQYSVTYAVEGSFDGLIDHAKKKMNGPRFLLQARLAQHADCVWQCNHCERRSLTKSELLVHTKLVHPSVDLNTFKPQHWLRPRLLTSLNVRYDAFVCIVRLEDMDRYKELGDILLENGRNLVRDLDTDNDLVDCVNVNSGHVVADVLDEDISSQKYRCLHCHYRAALHHTVKVHIQTSHAGKPLTALDVSATRRLNHEHVYMCNTCSFVTTAERAMYGGHFARHPTHSSIVPPQPHAVVSPTPLSSSVNSSSGYSLRSPSSRIRTPSGAALSAISITDQHTDNGISSVNSHSDVHVSTRRRLPTIGPIMYNDDGTLRDAELDVGVTVLACMYCTDLSSTKDFVEMKEHLSVRHPHQPLVVQDVTNVGQSASTSSYVLMCQMSGCDFMSRYDNVLVLHMLEEHPDDTAENKPRSTKKKRSNKHSSIVGESCDGTVEAHKTRAISGASVEMRTVGPDAAVGNGGGNAVNSVTLSEGRKTSHENCKVETLVSGRKKRENAGKRRYSEKSMETVRHRRQESLTAKPVQNTASTNEIVKKSDNRPTSTTKVESVFRCESPMSTSSSDMLPPVLTPQRRERSTPPVWRPAAMNIDSPVRAPDMTILDLSKAQNGTEHLSSDLPTQDMACTDQFQSGTSRPVIMLQPDDDSPTRRTSRASSHASEHRHNSTVSPDGGSRPSQHIGGESCVEQVGTSASRTEELAAAQSERSASQLSPPLGVPGSLSLRHHHQASPILSPTELGSLLSVRTSPQESSHKQNHDSSGTEKHIKRRLSKQGGKSVVKETKSVSELSSVGSGGVSPGRKGRVKDSIDNKHGDKLVKKRKSLGYKTLNRSLEKEGRKSNSTHKVNSKRQNSLMLNKSLDSLSMNKKRVNAVHSLESGNSSATGTPLDFKYTVEGKLLKRPRKKRGANEYPFRYECTQCLFRAAIPGPVKIHIVAEHPLSTGIYHCIDRRARELRKRQKVIFCRCPTCTFYCKQEDELADHEAHDCEALPLSQRRSKQQPMSDGSITLPADLGIAASRKLTGLNSDATDDDEDDNDEDDDGDGNNDTSVIDDRMFQCSHCSYITTDLHSIRMHVIAEHAATEGGFTEVKTAFGSDGNVVMNVNDHAGGNEGVGGGEVEGDDLEEAEKVDKLADHSGKEQKVYTVL